MPGSADYHPKKNSFQNEPAKQNWCFQRGRTVQAQQMHLVPKQAKDSTAAPLIICRVRHLRPDRCWRIGGGIFHPHDLMDSDALANDGSNAIWRDWLGPLTDGLVAGLWTPFYQTPAFIWAPCPAAGNFQCKKTIQLEGLTFPAEIRMHGKSNLWLDLLELHCNILHRMRWGSVARLCRRD